MVPMIDGKGVSADGNTFIKNLSCSTDKTGEFSLSSVYTWSSILV